ncbi:MAG: F0F1 ATP synthase subunit B [Candidatus Moraniibacteriota bacterium]|nr:MAG: F0F1 ATP synthase subunit B [Candidatus Moranbacteria bacterium]
MEILSKLGIDWRLFLAQLINFLIFFYVLRRFVFTPILKYLEERRKKIERGLEHAKKSEELHKKVKIEAEKIVLDAKREAKEILSEAHKEAKRSADVFLEKAKEESIEILQEVKSQAEEERRAYIIRFKSDIAKLVVFAAEKVVGKRWDSSEDKKFIEDILLDMSKKSS